MADKALRLTFDKGIPLYVQLAALFRRKVAIGEWDIGQRIPTLDELALMFGVARATVRQATGLLRDEGLLARFRGRGTIVLKRPKSPTHEDHADIEGLVASLDQGTFRTEVLRAHQRHIPSLGSAAYQYSLRRNSEAGVVRSVDHLWVLNEAFSAFDKKLRSGPAMTALTDMKGTLIHHANQTMTVDVADVELATLLKRPVHASIVVLERSFYRKDGALLCLLQSIYPGDEFRLKTSLW